MTATVVLLGVTAAGVTTLDIVAPPAPLAADGLRAAVDLDRAPVAVAPIDPAVEEVAVPGIGRDSSAARRPAGQRGSARLAPGGTEAAGENAVESDPTIRQGLTPGLSLAAVSPPQPAHGLATVGVTWAHGSTLGEDEIAVQIRSRTDGAWSDWTAVDYHDGHGPDADSAEAGRVDRPGTDALVVGEVDEVQMRAETATGAVPADLRLAVIDPGAGRTEVQQPDIDAGELPSARTLTEGADPDRASLSSAGTAAPDAGSSGDSAVLAMNPVSLPQIYSRAQWGANEAMRDKRSLKYGTIKTGFVHHTVNANNYSAADVPALLRGIYAYHTQSRGWSDVGYNFLVDRFGRVWEGRYGGVDKAVVGAHTLGYNEVSFAMSAIGNFETVQPPPELLNAYAVMMAWKLSLYGIRPDQTGINVKGKIFRAVNGHRDAGSTACPGKYLYAQLPLIRALGQQVQDQFQGGPPPAPQPPPKPTPPPPPPPAQPVVPPVPMTSPTQAPGNAGAQPSMSFPRSTTLAGASWPDLALKSPNGDIRVVSTGGQVGFVPPIASRGRWKRVKQFTVVGDLNGDGLGDALGRVGRRTHVFRGDSTGHISGRARGRTLAFARSNMLVGAGDWNGDGKPDVLSRNARSGALQLFLGYGGNRWAPPRTLAANWRGYRSTAAPGDVTGDGRPDVVALTWDGRLHVLPQTAAGGLGAPYVERAVGTGFDQVAGGGDLTGDGIADVLLRAGGAGVVLSGNGRGGFGEVLGPFHGLGKLRQMSVRQVAGAPQADIVGIRGGRVRLFSHTGRSNISAPLPGNLRVPGAVQVLSVGDWNRDGLGDLITRENGGDTLVLRPGKGNGSFAPGVPMGNGWAGVGDLSAIGDVSGDGNPDLVGRTGAGTVLFAGNGSTGFYAPVKAPASMKTFNLVGGPNWAAQAWAVARSSTGSAVPLGGAAGDLSAYDWVIGAGDADGDGRADLIVRLRGTGQLFLIPGGVTGVGAPRLIGSGFGGYQTAG